jgi:hypothetical protein
MKYGPVTMSSSINTEAWEYPADLCKKEKNTEMSWLDNLPFLILIIACLTLGLAPFTPEPHIWEKLKMLFAGELVRPVDIFDFLMHATPWILLFMKVVRTAIAR